MKTTLHNLNRIHFGHRSVRRFCVRLTVMLIGVPLLLMGCQGMGGPTNLTGDSQFFQGHRQSAKPPTPPEIGDGPGTDSEKPILPQITPNGSSETGPRIPGAPQTSKPKLELNVVVAERKQAGSQVTFEITLENTGEKAVENLAIQTSFEKPLTFPGHPNSVPRQMIGTLNTGQKHTISLTLLSEKAGKYCCGFSVRSDQRELLWKSVCVTFIPRQIEVRLVVPNLRTVGSRSEATLMVANIGNDKLADVKVTATFDDKEFKPLESTTGARLELGKLSWTFKSVKPGEAIPLQVLMECLKPTEKGCLRLSASAESLPEVETTACVKVEPVKGPWEMRITDTVDLLSVGDSSAVVILLINRSSQRSQPGRLTVDIPENFRVISSSVWQDQKALAVQSNTKGSQVTFEAATPIDVNGQLMYRVRVKAVRTAGDKFQASLLDATGKSVITREEPVDVNP
jgi:hypothetical protein